VSALERSIIIENMAICDLDEEREFRIHDEAVVDAHGEEERAIGWYYYLADKIQFPFKAKCLKKVSTSPLQLSQMVEVIGMADNEVCEHDMFVAVDMDGIKIDLPLRQLGPMTDDEDTDEAVADWQYWTNRGYRF
jgi:hypothetical protein